MIHAILPVGMLQCKCSILGDEASREAIVPSSARAWPNVTPGRMRAKTLSMWDPRRSCCPSSGSGIHASGSPTTRNSAGITPQIVYFCPSNVIARPMVAVLAPLGVLTFATSLLSTWLALVPGAATALLLHGVTWTVGAMSRVRVAPQHQHAFRRGPRSEALGCKIFKALIEVEKASA